MNRIKRCLENNEKIDLENFQLETDDADNENELFKPIDPADSWEKLDLFKVIDTEEPLMSTRREGTGEMAEDLEKN